jgi:tetraacyldisaccharide 4'-kinase
MNGTCPTRTTAGDHQSAYLRIISGRSECPCNGVLRWALAPLAVLYRAGLVISNLRYHLPRGVLRAARPVVSVGNLTVGGTGKTPMVALIARLCKELGSEPVIVSRGYHAQPGQANDESMEMERLAPGVPVIQNPDRWKAISDFTWHNPCGMAILDDGFQHRRLARDLDIVLVDATAPFGYGHVLPMGLLREPLSALWRADMVVITRTELVETAAVEEIRRRLVNHLRPGTPILVARNRPSTLLAVDGSRSDAAALKGAAVAAACGIGNPDAFAATLRAAGADVKSFSAFPDHYAYTAEDLANLLKIAEASGLKMLVTTGKDFVKWLPLLVSRQGPAGVEAVALEVVFEIVEGEDVLRQRLARLHV